MQTRKMWNCGNEEVRKQGGRRKRGFVENEAVGEKVEVRNRGGGEEMRRRRNEEARKRGGEETRRK